MSFIFNVLDACDCKDCHNQPNACYCDCERSEECYGCQINRQQDEEEEFDTKVALGYL